MEALSTRVVSGNGESTSLSTTRHAPTLQSAQRARAVADWRASQRPAPWALLNQAVDEDADKDSWLLTYMDIVTLLLTLFVVIFAYFKLSPTLPAEQVTKNAPGVEAATFQNTVKAETPAPQLSAPQTRDVPRMTMPQTWFTWPAATQTTIPFAPTNEPATAQINQQVKTPNRVEPMRAALQSMALGENIEVTEVANTLRIDLANDVIFKLGSADIEPRGQELLDRLAAMLKRNDYVVAVEGHTDDLPIKTPQFPSNWELSTHRATQVARYLIAQGVEPRRMSAVGYADTQPRFPNDTAEGRGKNRRVTFVLRVPGDDTSARVANVTP